MLFIKKERYFPVTGGELKQALCTGFEIGNTAFHYSDNNNSAGVITFSPKRKDYASFNSFVPKAILKIVEIPDGVTVNFEFTLTDSAKILFTVLAAMDALAELEIFALTFFGCALWLALLVVLLFTVLTAAVFAIGLRIESAVFLKHVEEEVQRQYPDHWKADFVIRPYSEVE